MSQPVYRFSGWTFDGGLRTLKNPYGDVVPLTPREVTLLRVFLDHPQEELRRKFLVDALYGGYPPVDGDKALNTQICRLRDKLQDRHTDTPCIQVVTGGYWFCQIPEPISPAAI